LMIWDVEESPILGDQTLVLWRGFADHQIPNAISIPKLVESNDEKLKNRYLAWIFDLGETSIYGARVVDYLELRPGFSYWWMTLFAEKCNFAKSPQIDNAIRMMAFVDWASAYSINRIELTSANKPLAQCVRLWCKKKGILFEFRHITPQSMQVSWVRQTYRSLPKLLREFLGLLLHIHNRWPLRGVGLNDWQQTNGRISFITYLHNLVPDAANVSKYESSYWAHLPDELRRKGCKSNWYHFYVKDDLLPTAEKAAETIINFNKKSQGEQVHVTQDTFLSLLVVYRALLDWMRLVFRGRRLKQAISVVPSKGLDLWPLFEEDWRQSMSGFVAMINSLNLNLFEAAMKPLPKQRVGVYLQENQGWEFALINTWKAAGHGDLIGSPHSVVRFWDLRYFFDARSYCRTGINALPLPNKVALNGVAAREAYINGNYPLGGLVEVEALRYLHLGGANTKSLSVTLPQKAILRLLVLGDYLPANTYLQMSMLEKAAKSLPCGTVITIKPHPSCPIDLTEYPNIRMPMSISLEAIFKLLTECDVAYASAITSAAVDAYCAGVPVVSVLDPNNLNLSPLRGREGALFASTPEELSRALISAVSVRRTTEIKENFFNLDLNLKRWKKLLLVPTKKDTR
jgi:surface carbohydrate biosynthesis protein (TIGR04326 family)